MLIFTICYAAPDLRISHHCTIPLLLQGPEGGIPDSNIAAALALIDKVSCTRGMRLRLAVLLSSILSFRKAWTSLVKVYRMQWRQPHTTCCRPALRPTSGKPLGVAWSLLARQFQQGPRMLSLESRAVI